jgi:cupin fold WbuC family metalloprotein
MRAYDSRMTPTFLARSELEALSDAARRCPRLRLNRNLHAMEDPVHRLLNAMEPGSYVRPHRHATPPKSETILVVAGELGLVLFDDAGGVLSATRLSAAGPLHGADLPPGTWHTLVALASGTVFFETKPGPYVPPGPEDSASWAPAEGDPGADRQQAALSRLFPG